MKKLAQTTCALFALVSTSVWAVSGTHHNTTATNVAYKVPHNFIELEANQPFKNPDEAPKSSKEDPLALHVDYTAVKYKDNNVVLRTYNGKLVGPTIRVNPGEKLHLKLINSLHANDPHAVTNLHTHGLHVAPTANHDNIFLQVAGKGSQSYMIDVPSDQYRGTQWYHPHVHGNTSFQVSQGMEGALIVNDDPAQIPASLKVTENILVIQSLVVGNPNPDVPFDVAKIRKASGNNQVVYMVNGQVTPVITMNPGEVQRWRMINATIGTELQLVLNTADNKPSSLIWNEIALDGMYLGTVDTWKTGSALILQPGNRSDVLLKAPTKCSTATDCPTVQLMSAGDKPIVIASVKFTTSGSSMSLPTAAEMKPLKTLVDIDISKIIPTAQVADFESSPFPPAPPFCDPNVRHSREPIDCINNIPFNSANPPAKLILDTTQEWHLSTPDSFSSVPHVFHIHINPFQAIRQGPDGKDELVWLDTLGIPAGTTKNKPVKVWTHYADFTGKSVFHCHVLPHEDAGMMQMIDIEAAKPAK